MYINLLKFIYEILIIINLLSTSIYGLIYICYLLRLFLCSSWFVVEGGNERETGFEEREEFVHRMYPMSEPAIVSVL